MRRHKNVFVAFWLSLTALLCACGDPQIHLSASVDSDGWTGRQRLGYHIDRIRQDGTYTLGIDVRLDRRYAYKDLWLEVETRTADSLLRKDTLRLDIVDDRGVMTGQGRNLLSYELPVCRLSLHRDESVDLVLRHLMQSDTLMGVHDVAVRLDR